MTVFRTPLLPPFVLPSMLTLPATRVRQLATIPVSDDETMLTVVADPQLEMPAAAAAAEHAVVEVPGEKWIFYG